MPKKSTQARARRDARAGKAPSTQAGNFVKAEIDRIRRGEHGAKNAKQAIAIGLSEARRAGVKVPARGGAGAKKKSAAKKKKRPAKHSPKRAVAAKRALQRQPRAAASHRALAKQARSSAKKRGPIRRKAAAKKAASTRQRRSS